MLIICWDFDGTLISSEVVYKDIFSKYLKNVKQGDSGFSAVPCFAKYGGKHPLNVLEDLKEEGFIDKDLISNEENIKSDFKKSLDKNGLLLTDGVVKVLEELSSFENVLMAIVTSTNKENFKLKYNNPSINILKKYFNINKNIYICGEVGNKELKPSPNGYLFAVNDIVSKNCLFLENNTLVAIEDSISGCKSAFNAKKELKNKINTIIIGYTVGNQYINEKELKNSGADFVFKTYDELLNFLKEMAVRPGLEPR
ncbi:MAG: HAD family phosphatase [Rickettsiales bacterium]|nr:HAD family phosphatase [Rickettsiales bacterium]